MPITPGPIPESAALAPMSPYGHHKRMMEQLCQSYVQSFGVRCMVVRLFSVYGPNLRKQLLWDICSRLRSEQRTLNLGGTGAEIRDWTDVRDVVRLLARVAEAPWQDDFGVINGGSGRGVSVAGIAEGPDRALGEQHGRAVFRRRAAGRSDELAGRQRARARHEFRLAHPAGARSGRLR